ncbi:uncharacterized protein PV09_09056 [Verruconis gallopava]|uniref:Small ribosomal subunit protein mS23 n=1 Tax=Verruconis gallopava TaxID=253628 RepID=A0A0D2AK05_9PEZI|nr:uncharacterized protein PV09_09056 [Verruconis gallopava]KIV99288.1 hypothetical protein PV09_09056 [Verruconis gallopava]
MGRYDFRAQRILSTANIALETKRISMPPVWHDVVQNIPPPPRVTRPVKSQLTKGMYKPQRIRYPEDALRQEFFSDHPWELARPRVVLEDSGDDHKSYNWSVLEQEGKRMDGESVVQRQLYLKQHGYRSEESAEAQPVSHYRAYDIARHEFYKHRHFEDVERRIAKEEALHTGAYFNLGPNAIAEPLEDAEFEKWKQWATERANQIKNARVAGYSGAEIDADDGESPEAARLSELAIAEEEERSRREELMAPRERLPATTIGTVADVAGEMSPFR